MGVGRLKKPEKAQIISHHGTAMTSIIERLKAHKSHKSTHEALTNMHDSVLRRPPTEGGMLKKAYEAGYKYAEDGISMNKDDDPNSVKGPANKEEAIVDVIRPGWPNPLDSAMRTHNKMMNKQQFSESASVKDLAKINANSPEVTV